MRGAIAGAAALAACVGRGGPPPDPGTSPILATMERSGCFGNCPHYRLTVHENGVVIFQRLKDEAGGEGTEPPRGRRLSRDELAALARAVERAGFSRLEDYDRDDCTDYQTVVLEWRGRRVVHYWGDQRAPRRLYDLEAAFDRIVDTRDWLGGLDPHDAGPNATFCGGHGDDDEQDEDAAVSPSSSGR